MDILATLSIPVVILVVIVALGVFVARNYHRVPPNEVMVLYGRGAPRLITSGGVFVIPVLESFKKLDVTIMTIKTEKDEVYTVSGVPIQLDWVAQVQIDGSDEALRTAARAFSPRPSSGPAGFHPAPRSKSSSRTSKETGPPFELCSAPARRS